MGGDSNAYSMPTEDVALNRVGTTLRNKKVDRNNPLGKLLTAFVDSTGQQTRISVSMADVGSVRLPLLLDTVRRAALQLFDTVHYKTTFTGTSVVFLEGSRFIIHSLRDSLGFAFIMIFGCMIILFRSWKIVLISIVVNIAPLLITAGVMGWMGIPLKPSTVLVFSVALGITVDVTIRFLVNFKQDLQRYDEGIDTTVRRTIRDTGLSIIYTSLILIAGFGVFCLSEFDGTKSLGFLTSLTLMVAMVTNLTLQPAMLVWLRPGKKEVI
jgi:predicted RND superfamily exporter protein